MFPFHLLVSLLVGYVREVRGWCFFLPSRFFLHPAHELRSVQVRSAQMTWAGVHNLANLKQRYPSSRSFLSRWKDCKVI